jgi:hypothetical protein
MPVPPVVLIAAYVPPPPDPRLAGMDLEGWDVVELTGGGAVTFSRPELGDQIPNSPQVWIRREQVGQGPKPSMLEVVRFNCSATEMRVMEAYAYARPNLDGARRSLQTQPGAWTALRGGRWIKGVFAHACDQ